MLSGYKKLHVFNFILNYGVSLKFFNRTFLHVSGMLFENNYEWRVPGILMRRSHF